MHRDPVDEAFLLPRVAEAQERLGQPAFSEAERAGRGIPYDCALAEVLAWLRQG
jgi:hypothetical protein